MIDASIRAVLGSKYTIRRFFWTYGGVLVTLLLLLIVIAAFAPQGWVKDASTNFLGNFAATVAIFLVTYGFYISVTPPGLRNAEVIPLQDVEISDKIIDLPAGASDYWFWGRSGSYFRTEVLPRLDAASREERRHIRVRAVIPDPAAKNAQLYMKIKRGLGESADEWTLPANIVATVAAVAEVCSRNPYLRCDLGLCPNLPVLRYDLSTSGALLTRDAKKLPAILINSGNAYFEMFRDAVENELAQSKKVEWDASRIAAITGDVISEDLLSAIDGLPSIPSGVIELAKKTAKRGHRYGR
jgi:hypothetical protein